MTSRDYLSLYNAAQAADSDEPGTKTFITTGMSDESFAQVLTGLSEGDVVLVTRESGTNSNSFMNMGGGMMFNMEGGGMPPSGGENIRFGSGGGTRPGGGN